MYITCQKCDTVFRLDDHLLKPTGSKVRCSQCGNVFLAVPPVSTEPALESRTPAPAGPVEAQKERASIDQAVQPEDQRERQGSTSMLEQSAQPQDSQTAEEHPQWGTETDPTETEAQDALSELTDADFDIDFDDVVAFDGLEEEAPTNHQTASTGESAEPDLALDFELADDDMLTIEEESRVEPTPEQALASGTTSGLEELFLDDEVLVPLTEEPAEANDGLETELMLDIDNPDMDMDESATLFADIADSPQSAQAIEELELDFELEDKPLQANGSVKMDLPLKEDIPELALDMDQELELDLDALEAFPAAENQTRPPASSALTDDFDLSDFEDAFNKTGQIEPDRSSLEQELNLDLIPDEVQPSSAEPEEAIEDLSLDLDVGFADEPLALADSSPDSPSLAEDDEIDLSDLEQMLEGEAPALASATSATTPDKSQRQDKWALDDGLGADLDDGEIDLSEIEAAIDEADDPSQRKTADLAEQDLALVEALEDEKLELEPKPDPLFHTHAIEDDDQLKLSDLGGMLAGNKKRVESEMVHANDMELEFQIEDQAPVMSAASDDGDKTMVSALMHELDTSDTARQAKPQATYAATLPKKKSSAPLVIIIVLILLAALGYGVYYAVTQLGIQIPYISDYLNPQPQDPTGVRSLSTPEINSKFIENSQSGKLFVITGKVLNGYPKARTRIQLQGKLFTKGKVLAKSESVYAGITLNDQELATGNVADLKKRLNSAPQAQDPAVKVLPNRSLPFMVIFSELPAANDLDEFAVEPMGSELAQ